MKKLTILALALLIAGCMQAPQTDLDGLKAMRDVWQSAYDTNDAALIAAIYAEDGAVMPPNAETVHGRAAIEEFFGGFQATGMAIEIQDNDAYAHGDVGYKIGSFTIVDADGTTIDVGKYVEIWRHIDGKWQMYRDIFNSDLALPAAEADTEADAEAGE